MNLKKALVGCFLALSLVVGVVVSIGNGSLSADGEHFPPINAGKVKVPAKVGADGEHFPPINAGKKSIVVG